MTKNILKPHEPINLLKEDTERLQELEILPDIDLYDFFEEFVKHLSLEELSGEYMETLSNKCDKRLFEIFKILFVF